MKNRNIAFFYYNFYPVDGGASVHGYNLVKELSKKGFKLYKVNGNEDLYSYKFKNILLGIIFFLRNCSIFYVRLDYSLSFRNLVPLIGKVFNKKIIVELNSPSDELILRGKSNKTIRFYDFVFSKYLRVLDKVLVVSNPIKNYCTEKLKLSNVVVVPNGGEVFSFNDNTSHEIKAKVDYWKRFYKKIVIWSGSGNKMQNLSFIKALIDKLDESIAIIIVYKHIDKDMSFNNSNVYILNEINRDDVKYIIKNSDVGLAFYENYDWCRWGFYNSPLKIYEYLSNHIYTISNITEDNIKGYQGNIYFYSNNVKRIANKIMHLDVIDTSNLVIRTWSDVAEEIFLIINEL